MQSNRAKDRTSSSAPSSAASRTESGRFGRSLEGESHYYKEYDICIYIYVIFLSVKYVQPLTPIHFNDCDSGCLIALHFNHSNWKECLLLLAFERCQQSQQHQPLASLPIGTMADPIDSTCKSFKSLTAWCVLDLFFREKMMRSQTFSQ